MTKKARSTARITRIQLVEAVGFGDGSIVDKSIGIDSQYFGTSEVINIAFDEDDRFLRVTIGKWTSLIPLSNVGLIRLDPT